MRNIQLLDDFDLVQPDDYCRPLGLTFSFGGELFETGTYSGKPQNNLKWIRVSEVWGACWYNKTVAELNDGPQQPHEFVRGNLPNSHMLDG